MVKWKMNPKVGIFERYQTLTFNSEHKADQCWQTRDPKPSEWMPLAGLAYQKEDGTFELTRQGRSLYRNLWLDEASVLADLHSGIIPFRLHFKGDTLYRNYFLLSAQVHFFHGTVRVRDEVARDRFINLQKRAFTRHYNRDDEKRRRIQNRWFAIFCILITHSLLFYGTLFNLD